MMDTGTKIAVAAAALAAVGLTAAAVEAQGRFAGPRTPDPAMMGVTLLQIADLNGDDVITRTELEALQTEEFDFRDRNGDGYLTEADASPAMQRVIALREAGDALRPSRRGMGRMLERVDGDGDGRISRAEFTSREPRVFERADADGDGRVTPAELDALVEARQDRRERRRFWWRD